MNWDIPQEWFDRLKRILYRNEERFERAVIALERIAGIHAPPVDPPPVKPVDPQPPVDIPNPPAVSNGELRPGHGEWYGTGSNRFLMRDVPAGKLEVAVANGQGVVGLTIARVGEVGQRIDLMNLGTVWTGVPVAADYEVVVVAESPGVVTHWRHPA